MAQTVAGLAATLGVGALVDRVSPRWLTTAAMAALTTGLLWGSVVSPGWSALGYGAAGGAIRSLEAASLPRYFGTVHIGSIRGVVTAISIGSNAFGPVVFALVREATGSFSPALLGTAALPAAVGVAALWVRPPAPPVADLPAPVGDG